MGGDLDTAFSNLSALKGDQKHRNTTTIAVKSAIRQVEVEEDIGSYPALVHPTTSY